MVFCVFAAVFGCFHLAFVRKSQMDSFFTFQKKKTIIRWHCASATTFPLFCCCFINCSFRFFFISFLSFRSLVFWLDFGRALACRCGLCMSNVRWLIDKRFAVVLLSITYDLCQNCCLSHQSNHVSSMCTLNQILRIRVMIKITPFFVSNPISCHFHDLFCYVFIQIYSVCNDI